MSNVYEPYIAVLLVGILVTGMAAAILILNRVFGPSRPTAIKGIPYESGVDPVQTARRRFSVKFYLTAILFLVFDLEVVFILPWAVNYKSFLADPSFAAIAFGGMAFFVAVLALGLLYEWKRGSLNWE